MSRIAGLAALLLVLCQLAPTSTSAAVVLTTTVVALVVATMRRGTVLGHRPVPVRVRTMRAEPSLPSRQYEPATAGRPQPRAPGCGR